VAIPLQEVRLNLLLNVLQQVKLLQTEQPQNKPRQALVREKVLQVVKRPFHLPRERTMAVVAPQKAAPPIQVLLAAVEKRTNIMG